MADRSTSPATPISHQSSITAKESGVAAVPQLVNCHIGGDVNIRTESNMNTARKQSRGQSDEDMDETDHVNTSTKNILNPDLKKFNTSAKLEEWVSDPQNKQSAIEKLKKLATGQMKDLEMELKDKKLKKFLCFSGNDVTKINSDRSLKSYLKATKDAKFPVKLARMLFEKNRDYASPDNDSSLEDNSESYSNNNERTDVQQNTSSSSGYGSSISSSLNSNQSQNTDGSHHTSIPFSQLQAENHDDAPLTETMDMQENISEPNESTSVVTNSQTEVQTTTSPKPGQEQSNSSSTPSNDSKERKDDRSKLLTQNKLKKNKDKMSVLKNWAMEKCHSEGGLERLRDCISVINIAEHREYPFLVAEKVWVYKNPENDERQVIVFSNEEKISSRTETLANYQMFLCGIEKAVILGQQKKEIGLDISKVPEPVDLCLKLILEVFVPALAVFKDMQSKGELSSLL